MNPGLTVLLTVAGLIVASIPIYFLAKSNAREARRQRNDEVVSAVRAALEPKEAELARRDAVINAQALAIRDRDETIRDRNRRIEELEDQLRGGLR